MDEGWRHRGVTFMVMKGKSGSDERIACSSSWLVTSKMLVFE
jgi:hypothetical protein